MATKKTNSKAPAKQQKRSTPNISARIDRLVDYENSKVKAIASVNIGGAFAIHGLRVIDSQKGLFVQMPQNSFQKDGKSEYSDIFHPITADARTELKPMSRSSMRLSPRMRILMKARISMSRTRTLLPSGRVCRFR